MYLILGKENCNRCEITKTILNNKKIEYQYKLLEDLPEEKKKTYIQMARESNQLEYPLIIKDEKIITLQEVV